MSMGFLIIVLIFYYLFEGPINRRSREKRLIKAGMVEIDGMKGYQFEEFLSVLYKKLGYQVFVTKNSGDFGAVLLLQMNNIKIAVQAKRYKSKVSIKAVQEIVSAKAYYHADEIWLITNNYFTGPAIKLAKSNGVKLINRDELTDLILSLQSDKKLDALV